MIVIGGPSGGGKSTAFPRRTSPRSRFLTSTWTLVARNATAGLPSGLLRRFAGRRTGACATFASSTSRRAPASPSRRPCVTTLPSAWHEKPRLWDLQPTFTLWRSTASNATCNESPPEPERAGHSAPVSLLRDIYTRSIAHLPLALATFNHVTVVDNTHELTPLVTCAQGRITARHPAIELPDWLKFALGEESAE